MLSPSSSRMGQVEGTEPITVSEQQAQGHSGPHFFAGAHTFRIDQQTNVVHHHTDAKDLLSMLNPIANACYARDRKLSPPDSNCLPGTRRKLLKQVQSWIDSSLLLQPQHVMWIYGYVGCGKSSIAQAVAEMYARKNRLAGSFFFFRGAGDRCRTGRFAATMAGQLAAAIPETAPFLEQAVRAHAGLLTTYALGAQFEHLIYRPLKTFSRLSPLVPSFLRHPYLIVIDGLDECDDREEIAAFIDHMLDFFRKHPRIPLRFLITSRVEEHLQTHLDSSEVHLLNLVHHTSLVDISAVVDATFTLAAKHDRVIRAYGDWPSRGDRQKLVEHSGGSVIFMSTILKFILGPSADGLTPMERLPLALNINPGLDGLYSQTLSRSEHLPHFFNIITAIMIFVEPHSILELGLALGIQAFEVVRVLVNLHSILQVPGDDHTPVTICHTSLRDFIQDQARSGHFYISTDRKERVFIRLLRGYEERNQSILPKIVTTIAVSMEPLSIIQLAFFFGLDTSKFIQHFDQQKAIIQTPGDFNATSLSHESFSSSFYRFLNAQEWSPIHFLLLGCQTDLAYACFEAMSNPLSPASVVEYARLHGMEHWIFPLRELSGNPASFAKPMIEEAVTRLRGYSWKRTAVDAVLCVLLTMEGAANTFAKRPSGISMSLFAKCLSPIANEEQIILIAEVVQEVLGHSRQASLVDIKPDIMHDIQDMEDHDLEAVVRAHLALLLWLERQTGLDVSPLDVLTDGIIIQRIVNRAQRSPIFVSEFAKFIMHSRKQSRVDEVRTVITQALNAKIPLDHLYIRLLSLAESHDPNFYRVLSDIASGRFNRIVGTSRSLNIPVHQVRSILEKLRGISHLPDDDSTAFSFPEHFLGFLQSRSRAGRFFVSAGLFSPTYHHWERE